MNRVYCLLAAGWLLVFAGIAQAQNQTSCGNDKIHGTYSASCTGFVTPPGAPPGTPQVPLTGLGTATVDQDGNAVAQATIMIAGLRFQSTLKGKGTTNPDCITGRLTYNQGQPDQMDIEYVTYNSGRIILGLQVNPGTNVLCHLERIKP